jgi:hypothetical protein
MCATFAAIYAQRDALADAFDAALNGRTADASDSALAIAARLQDVLNAMPSPDQLSSADRLLQAIAVGDSIQVSDAAHFLEPMGNDLPTRDEVLSAATAVAKGDATLQRDHDDSVAPACPALSLALRPIAFPASSSEASRSPTLIHFENRSAVVITPGPDVSIPACGSIAVTREAYDAAQLAGGRMNSVGMAWPAPSGAVFWDNLALAGSMPTELTVIISGKAPVSVRVGVVAPADLPACGGAPQGIEPGLPPGQVPTMTVLP